MNQLYFLSPLYSTCISCLTVIPDTRTHSTFLSDFLSDPCVHELIGDSSFASSMDPQSFHPSLKSRPLPPSPSSLTSFPILAISIVGIVTTSVLLLSYYVFVIKRCLNWHRSDVVSRLSRSRRRRRRAGPFMAFSNTAKGLGLDESAIQAIPTFRYREEADSVAECAVCLNGFHEEERIKLLPDCFHVFHIDCIDTWLQANANCPLCRSSITAPIPTAHLMALVPSSDPYRRNEAVVEVRDVGSDLVGTLTTTNTNSPWKTEQRLGHKKGRKLQYLSSMGDECIDLREKDEQFCDRRMRRSFSMGSSGDRQLDMALQKILRQNSQLQDVDGEISSSSGRYQRSFFSFGPSSPSAILPLQIELRSKRNLLLCYWRSSSRIPCQYIRVCRDWTST